MENGMLLEVVILTKIIYQTQFIYDLASDRWSQRANLPAARGALTANFIKGILYVGGGG